MARKSDGEKIDELKELGARLSERASVVAKEVETLDNAYTKAAESLAELRREHEKETALLKREIEDLKKWKDEQKKQHDEVNRRFWAFGPNLLAALVSGVIAFVVAYLTSHR